MTPDRRELAWRFFELHAKQRINVFNFFVVLSGLILTGIGSALRQGGASGHVLMAVFGLLLALLSAVFWQLDSRTRELIHTAEDVLGEVEDGVDMTLFARPEVETSTVRRLPLRYSVSLRIVFTTFGIVGLAAGVWGLTTVLAQ